MTQNLKKFLEAVSKDETLQAKVNELAADKENAMTCIIVLAKKQGMELTEADFAKPEGEISEEDLGNISGGNTDTGYCVCAAAGGGGGTTNDGDVYGCACAAYGQGGDAKDDHTVCMCVVFGNGGN